MNITLTVPEGSTNHGNPGLLCSPPKWYNYVVFFGTNYFSHAATVVSLPGQSIQETIMVLISALFLPSSGVARAIDVILSHPITFKDPLQRAMRANALCMVVRDEHINSRMNKVLRLSHRQRQAAGTPDQEAQLTSPKSALTMENAGPEPPSGILQPPRSEELDWWGYLVPPVHGGAKVHGQQLLPKGYSLAIVPDWTVVKFDNSQDSNEQDGIKYSNAEFACNYNIPKLLVSFIQAAWAIITLYQTRGDQIEQYGFAAFGLTVAPFAFMSVVNIIANASTPEYPTLYLIKTPLMEEAIKEHGSFDGVVGTVDHSSTVNARNKLLNSNGFSYWSFLAQCVSLAMAFVPLAIVGSLSGFRKQHSTALEQGFTMAWLGAGCFFGLSGHETIKNIFREGDDEEIISILSIVPLIAPGIGGMVIVGKMFYEFGTCTRLN
ncbi:hypothetical protein B0H63DRAFT_315143 [Podospora didyma]|uniref:Uncharacterized protein n=1 Tax=Podospora didyma TaxID=330526 RepID=A0AAE0K598_9PEZI|nr:hypothetical protein B0H63DRAFT_315143 [Podospora didyma]